MEEKVEGKNNVKENMKENKKNKERVRHIFFKESIMNLCTCKKRRENGMVIK